MDSAVNVEEGPCNVELADRVRVRRADRRLCACEAPCNIAAAAARAIDAPREARSCAAWFIAAPRPRTWIGSPGARRRRNDVCARPVGVPGSRTLRARVVPPAGSRFITGVSIAGDVGLAEFLQGYRHSRAGVCVARGIRTRRDGPAVMHERAGAVARW